MVCGHADPGAHVGACRSSGIWLRRAHIPSEKRTDRRGFPCVPVPEAPVPSARPLGSRVQKAAAVAVIGAGGLAILLQAAAGRSGPEVEYLHTAEITAHRGASANYPENTMSAFYRAVQYRGGDLRQIFPLGNNNLERFLIRESAEIVEPGVLDFCLFCANNDIMDQALYRRGGLWYPAEKAAFQFLCRKRREMNALTEGGLFPGAPLSRKWWTWPVR